MIATIDLGLLIARNFNVPMCNDFLVDCKMGVIQYMEGANSLFLRNKEHEVAAIIYKNKKWRTTARLPITGKMHQQEVNEFISRMSKIFYYKRDFHAKP